MEANNTIAELRASLQAAESRADESFKELEANKCCLAAVEKMLDEAKSVVTDAQSEKERITGKLSCTGKQLLRERELQLQQCLVATKNMCRSCRVGFTPSPPISHSVAGFMLPC